MAEKIVSPGVFTKEIDASFLPAAIGEIGAAVVGPTVKGPAGVPTVVESYTEYQALFGDVFKSGSGTYQYLTSVAAHNYLRNAGKLTVVRILDGSSVSGAEAAVTASGIAGTDVKDSFTIKTRADGAIMNSSDGTNNKIGTNNILLSGSKDNLRWEISQQNPAKGTFTLLVRRGDDTIKRKQILETWNNVSLDPNSSNYIAKTIGDSYASVEPNSGDPYVDYKGEYPNKSNYIYISDVAQTVDYLDENGNIRVDVASASLPALGSGSLHGGFSGGDNGIAGFDSLGNITTGSAGGVTGAYNFYGDIDSSNSQGYYLDSTTNDKGGSSYIQALNLLANADEYDINLVLIPGICDDIGGAHPGIITKAIDICESRGDCFLIYDAVSKAENAISNVTGKAKERDSNYAATYWPWCQISDSQTGAFRWVPPSSILCGIYAFNDKVAAPWFAPAGLNRGGLDTVVQAARKLTHSNRDDLYEANVNPIATFPGQGVVVWGQKTLQKKSSALDRVNVRRLLIKVKKFISASSRFLVFEQNNAATRNRFLNIANPYLEQVQAQSGLNAFRVVMDETNNTPDLVDRNILYGQLFLQPTKTAEFIVLDFTIQPTGAAFPE